MGFVTASLARLIAIPRSAPDIVFPAERIPLPYTTKVQHAESADTCDAIGMKMMDCSELRTLVINHEPIELIDVRSKKEFAAMHIPRARSVPFAQLAARKIFRRGRRTKARVYVISNAGHARASLATGILRSAGCVNAVPVDGGMKDWVARGFPLRRKKSSISSALDFIGSATLPVMAASVAAAMREFTAAVLLFAIAVVLNLRSNSSAPRRRPSVQGEPAHAKKPGCVDSEKEEIA